MLIFLSTLASLFVVTRTKCICETSFERIELKDLRQLEKGETTFSCVCGGFQWSALDVKLEEGDIYQLQVPPTETWSDYRKTSDCSGYDDEKFIKLMCCDDQWVDMSLFEHEKRSPEHNWNALICCAGKLSPKDAGSCTSIGFSGTLEITNLDGFDEFNIPDIYCFANDINHFHHDNDGAVNVTITRIN